MDSTRCGGEGVIIITLHVASTFLSSSLSSWPWWWWWWWLLLLWHQSLSPKGKAVRAAGQPHVHISQGGGIENASVANLESVLGNHDWIDIVVVVGRQRHGRRLPSSIGTVPGIKETGAGAIVIVRGGRGCWRFGKFVILHNALIQQFQVPRSPHPTNLAANASSTRMTDLGKIVVIVGSHVVVVVVVVVGTTDTRRRFILRRGGHGQGG
mmetsp:Transcript_12995/g.29465  ORF Transcript_12995/g.29465 Transcript_12995/m.29465 type:complete len:210 (-) Transcript_12995:233-862(-)